MNLTTLLKLLLLSTFFLSCKKDQFKPYEEDTNNSFPVKKIIAWLDAEKAKVHADSAKLMDVLKQNLITEGISEEQLDNGQILVMVPIKNDYKTTNTTEIPTFKKLVVTIVQSEIVDGNIVELIPRSGQTGKVNLIDLFHKKLLNYNGIVSTLSVFGKFKTEEVYKDGKLYSRTELTKKEKTKKKSGGAFDNRENFSYVTCYDWFITTTIFNRDGSVFLQFREYIGYSCTGLPPSCELNRVITTTKSYFRSCGGGGGGTGGGGGEEPPPGCDATAEYPEKAEFNSYISLQSASPIFQDGPTSLGGGDPISGSITWIVQKASIANWKIVANTDYSYFHYRHFNGNTMAYEDSYDLFHFHTGDGYYVGSNVTVSSVYTTTSPTINVVLNNKTANTVGISHVRGTIRHKMNIAIRIPFCEPLTLDITDIIENKLTFRPK